MSEYLTAALMLLMYGVGFTTAAALCRDTPFWRGWRWAMSFGLLSRDGSSKPLSPAEGDAYYFAVECWGAEWTKNEWESLLDFADLQARNMVEIEIVPSGIGGNPAPETKRPGVA